MKIAVPYFLMSPSPLPSSTILNSILSLSKSSILKWGFVLAFLNVEPSLFHCKQRKIQTRHSIPPGYNIPSIMGWVQVAAKGHYYWQWYQFSTIPSSTPLPSAASDHLISEQIACLCSNLPNSASFKLKFEHKTTYLHSKLSYWSSCFSLFKVLYC